METLQSKLLTPSSEGFEEKLAIQTWTSYIISPPQQINLLYYERKLVGTPKGTEKRFPASISLDECKRYYELITNEQDFDRLKAECLARMEARKK